MVETRSATKRSESGKDEKDASTASLLANRPPSPAKKQERGKATKDGEGKQVATSALLGRFEQRQRDRAEQRRMLQRERERSIHERLKQLGYEPEIRFFHPVELHEAFKVQLRKLKPLTDEEWDRISPECTTIMDKLRSQRLEALARNPGLLHSSLCQKGRRFS